ncbi:LacI family DNA-binding transcriptional regulator [Cryptosporangium japonicum]|uniref:LacI family DNA-binding transcriptional regulator n=1 Tax=Cryptosporangium japonicum TaxID=80872 RepID=A0ABN0UCY3_9ACTN
MSKGPTIRDVAARAGTSTAVVSYVLNDGPRPVAPETRARVRAAIDALGYRPNRSARALRANRTGTLGLVVPDLAKPFFAELTRAIEDAAFARGHRLLVGSAQFDAGHEEQQLQALVDAHVDAVLLAPAHDPAAALELLRRAELPHVLVHRTVGAAPGVAGDDLDAGRRAAAHLSGHGYRRVAVLGAAEGDDPVGRRTRGALAGLAGPPDAVVECAFTDLRGDAYRAATRLLAGPVEAICATTDEHALGVIRAAAEAGRVLGTDLGLISVDGTELGAYLGLSAVTTPFAELGVAAVGAVLDGAPGRTVPMTLVTRSSCGCVAPDAERKRPGPRVPEEGRDASRVRRKEPRSLPPPGS